MLDVACGPGGWALELAQAYPHMQVTGFDISAGMIDYAKAQAHASLLDNVHFFVANAMQPFDFPADSFDLVNVRHLEGVIPVAVWPEMLKEMFRVTRPGGIIRLTDCEWGVTNGAANEKLLELAIHAMQAVRAESLSRWAQLQHYSHVEPFSARCGLREHPGTTQYPGLLGWRTRVSRRLSHPHPGLRVDGAVPAGNPCLDSPRVGPVATAAVTRTDRGQLPWHHLYAHRLRHQAISKIIEGMDDL